VNARKVQPPRGGDDPPTAATLVASGQTVDLPVLATVICRQYRREFPDEQGRYGDAGVAWCIHDNQHLLNWATRAVNGELDAGYEVAWLANVLEARDFPLDRLARDLDIAAEVVTGRLGGAGGRALANELTALARMVRSEDFRDYPV